MPWTATDLPDLTGITVLIAGATSGLGEAATIALACRNAHLGGSRTDARSWGTCCTSRSCGVGWGCGCHRDLGWGAPGLRDALPTPTAR